MTADVASAIFATPNAAGLAAAPAKGAAVGFEALLTALFGPAPGAGAPGAGGGLVQTKTPAASKPADDAGDTALAALQSLTGLLAPAPLTATADPTSAKAGDPQAKAGGWTASRAQASAGQILAAGLAAEPSVPANATLAPANAPAPTLGADEAGAAPKPPVKSATTPQLPTLPAQSAAPMAIANAPSRAPAEAAVVATVIASTIDTQASAATAKAQAVVADTPATDLAAGEAGPIFGAKTPGPSAKADARSAPARATTAEPAARAAEAAAKTPERPVAPLAAQADDDHAADAAARSAPHEAAEAAPESDAAQPSAAAQAAATPQPAASALTATPPRANTDTVSRLAAQIASRASAKSTQFDIALEPAGLGKVDVRVQIAADGALTAMLAFATPHAAHELRARAGELQQALQQAGFNLSDGALSFDVAGQDGRGPGHGQAQVFDTWHERTLRAFAALDDESAAKPSHHTPRRAAAGVDIRI